MSHSLERQALVDGIEDDVRAVLFHPKNVAKGTWMGDDVITLWERHRDEVREAFDALARAIQDPSPENILDARRELADAHTSGVMLVQRVGARR